MTQVQSTQPRIRPFVLGEWQTNCYVVSPDHAHGKPSGQPCWIVDCGFDPDEMLDWIEQQQLQPQAILLTHAHLDHIGGVERALGRLGRVPIMIHEAEAGFCEDPLLNLSAMIGMPTTCPAPDRLLKHGDVLELGDTRWRVLHTPGHSPGGACFVNEAFKQAIVGDTLFYDSIGRYDFPTSNANDLRRSIHEVIMKLDDDFAVYPGHGPDTTVGRERRNNPFVLDKF